MAQTTFERRPVAVVPLAQTPATTEAFGTDEIRQETPR
jgi:hypothetical protein